LSFVVCLTFAFSFLVTLVDYFSFLRPPFVFPSSFLVFLARLESLDFPFMSPQCSRRFRRLFYPVLLGSAFPDTNLPALGYVLGRFSAYTLPNPCLPPSVVAQGRALDFKILKFLRSSFDSEPPMDEGFLDFAVTLAPFLSFAFSSAASLTDFHVYSKFGFLFFLFFLCMAFQIGPAASSAGPEFFEF